MTKKQDKKYLFKICELLATIGLLGNTIILIIFRNTLTYEEVSLLDFLPTPKSSYLTIIQHNPIFAIVYIFCGMVLLLCGIYRLADIGTEGFEEADKAFRQTPDFTECTTETMEALIENTERSDMVATNIGKVPIEDYREIIANQNGFDSYDELYNEGIRIGNGYDKEPEPIKPQ